MSTYKLLYGKETLVLDSQDIDLLDVIRINNINAIPNPNSAIAEALKNPIGSQPLQQMVSPGDKVAIIVNDDTRLANTHIFLPFLLNEIKVGGVLAKDIVIVFANGTHRLLPTGKQKELIGPEVYKNYKIINHDCHDKESLTYIGETSRGNKIFINQEVSKADKVVLTGSIVYHFFAGYGGGRKALIPGVAGYDTVLFNHRMMLEKAAQLGKLEGNPVHEDMLEGVAMIKPTFLFNVVLNDKNEFLGIFAGDYLKAHQVGCALVEQVYSVPIERTADLVIASCGGYPKDLNLYQAQKTLENAVHAVKPGGVIILVAQCSELLGSSALEEWLDRFSSPEAIEEAIKSNFVIGGHKAYAITRLTKKARIIIISQLPLSIVRKIYFTPAASLQEAIGYAKKFLNNNRPTAYIMPQGSLTVPIERTFI